MILENWRRAIMATDKTLNINKVENLLILNSQNRKSLNIKPLKIENRLHRYQVLHHNFNTMYLLQFKH